MSRSTSEAPVWAGGLVGDYLLKRGWSLNKVRKTCLVGGMLVCSVIALAAIAPEAWQALVLMSISYAAAAFTIVSIWCLPADVVDSSTVNGSCVRTPNGSDTNNLTADWAFSTAAATPGGANP